MCAHTKYDADNFAAYSERRRQRFCSHFDLAQWELCDRRKKRHRIFYAIFTHTFHNHVQSVPSQCTATPFNIVLLKIYFDRHSPIFRTNEMYMPLRERSWLEPTFSYGKNASQRGAIIIRQRNGFKWSLYYQEKWNKNTSNATLLFVYYLLNRSTNLSQALRCFRSFKLLKFVDYH